MRQETGKTAERRGRKLKKRREVDRMYIPTVNKKYYQQKIRRAEESKIRELYHGGKEVYEIAEELGQSEYQVRKILGLV